MNLIRPMLLLFVILLGTGCASTKEIFDFEEDSYFTLAQAWETERKSREMVISLPTASTSDTLFNQKKTEINGYARDEYGNIIIREGDAPQAFSEEQYHDFSYAARVRRFGETSGGWNYYDPYYTNHYWYEPQPAFFGQSIYTTYSWWGGAPLYPWQSTYSWFQPYAWHGNTWMHPHGFYPITGWGWYTPPFHPGNPLYYNSFDIHSVYSGPRKFNRGENQTSGPVIMSRVAPSHGVTPRPREPVRLSTLPVTRTPAPGTDRNPMLPNANGNPVRQTNQPTRSNFPTSPGVTSPGRTPSANPPIQNSPDAEILRPGSRTRFDNSSDNGMIRDVPTRSSDNQGIKTNDSDPRRISPPSDGGRRREIFQEGSRSPSWTRPATPPQRSTPERYNAPTRSNPSPQFSPPPRPSSPPPMRSSGSPGASPRSSSPRPR